MIDNLISDSTKQIWIIWALYFKSYEFSNFKGFSRIFWIYLNLFWIFKRINKCFYLSRADMAERHHVAMCVHTTWRRMHPHVRARVRCVRVCARVWLISGLHIHYGFSLTHSSHALDILVKILNLCHVGLFLFVLIYKWRGAMRRV